MRTTARAIVGRPGTGVVLAAGSRAGSGRAASPAGLFNALSTPNGL
jgi:hypothetical protein